MGRSDYHCDEKGQQNDEDLRIHVSPNEDIVRHFEYKIVHEPQAIE
jgi:hypothetical protein